MRPSRYACVGRQFWDHIRDGMSPGDAGVAVGVSAGTGQRWFADAGGMRPQFPDESAPRTRPRLTEDERNAIQDGVARGESINQMARQLQRASSTVMREIKRNAMCQGSYRARFRFGAQWKGGWDPTPRYRASTAQAGQVQGRGVRGRRVILRGGGSGGQCRGGGLLFGRGVVDGA